MLHRVSLLVGYDKTGKSFQAQGRTKAPTCTDSKNKKCKIWNGNLWSYGGAQEYSSEKRAITVCELKHKGGYKRMVHRVLQNEAGNSYTIRQPKQEPVSET